MMRSICLVGFMGAGKSAVGAALAERLAIPMVDLDQEIERLEGMSVYRIFAEKGEAYFRRREWEVLKSLGDSGMILSLGGGAFTIDDNIDLVNARSESVWLQCPIEICIQRCAVNAQERPLFRDPEELARLYEHRKKYYKRARHHVDSGSGTPAEIAERVLRAIGVETPATS